MSEETRNRRTFVAWLFGMLFVIFTAVTVVLGIFGLMVGIFTGFIAIVFMFCLVAAFFSKNIKGFIDGL